VPDSVTSGNCVTSLAVPGSQCQDSVIGGVSPMENNELARVRCAICNGCKLGGPCFRPIIIRSIKKGGDTKNA